MRAAVSALAPALLLIAAPAAAAERYYAIGSFDRIRIDGPFEVTLTTGKAPGAHAAADARTLDALTIQVEGTTLIVRMGAGDWGETAAQTATAPAITLTTPQLSAVNVNAGARLTIARMAGQRIDLSVNGAGALTVAGIEADQLNATLIGNGSMTLGGRAQRARLLTSGAGGIDSTGLAVNDLTVRLDGTGETRAAARYTATVTTTGLGRVTVAGNPACIVKAIAGGPVICGHH